MITRENMKARRKGKTTQGNCEQKRCHHKEREFHWQIVRNRDVVTRENIEAQRKEKDSSGRNCAKKRCGPRKRKESAR